MDYDHPMWHQFVDILAYKLGCFETEEGWPKKCDHTLGKACDLMIGVGLNDDEIEQSIKFFEDNGGFCDCEILLNVIGNDPHPEHYGG